MKERLEFDWLKPSPLWEVDGLGFRNLGFFRPQIFEFRSDTFMEDFLAAAAERQPIGLKQALISQTTQDQPLRLFQPSHGCFYLVAGTLCCRQPGFPDRELRVDDGENVFFVLRKLVDGIEYAWVVEDSAPHWKKPNGQARTAMSDEERHPLFGTISGNGRHIFYGYLPVASRETYGVKADELKVLDQTNDMRIQQLGSRFATPLTVTPPDSEDLVGRIDDDEIALTVSVYLLAELWEFLDAQPELADLTQAIEANNLSPTFSGDRAVEKSQLMAFLRSQVLHGSVTLASALHKAADKYEELNAPGGGDLAELGFDEDYDLRQRQDLDNADLQELLDKVSAALSDELPSELLPKLQVSASVRYVLRFVYERPQCDPAQIEVSLPSQPFTFAPFFDPEAPARPVRIALPSDVSIAGLRKANKNVTFMMSNAMRKKMNMLLGKEESLLSDDPQTNAEDELNFAFICSFSIQIIFIVAFMLLLIFVVVFNIIFWWLPFFKICFPVPKGLLPE